MRQSQYVDTEQNEITHDDTDTIEVYVTVHGNSQVQALHVQRGATIIDILNVVQEHYRSLGGELDMRGWQVQLNDHSFVLDAYGELQGEKNYAVTESATLTMSRELHGGVSFLK